MMHAHISITEAEHLALKRLSDLTDIAYAELVRRAIDRYLAAPDVTLPEQSPRLTLSPSVEQ